MVTAIATAKAFMSINFNILIFFMTQKYKKIQLNKTLVPDNNHI